MSKKFLPLYISAKLIKIDRDFPKLWSQMYCHLFYGSQCILLITYHWSTYSRLYTLICAFYCTTVLPKPRSAWDHQVQLLVVHPQFSTELRKRSYSYPGVVPAIWNGLPVNTRLFLTTGTFRRYSL